MSIPIRATTDKAKDERRQAILAAALDEFFERGFKAARMDDIARRAGLSKGALYLYFDTKEALFSALVDAYAVPSVQRIEAIVAGAPSAAAAIHALTAFAPAIIDETPLPRVLKVLIADAGNFPELAAQYRRAVIDRGLAALAGLIEHGGKGGAFEAVDAQLAARLIVAPVLLAAIWKVVFERDGEAPIDLQALFRLHEQLLLRALGDTKGDAT
jgi:AcrR family transcriptional regulator